MTEAIIVPEPPPGFPKQTMPVKDERRIPEEDIVISPIGQEDMLDFAAGLYDAFPQPWWDKHEPRDRRPPPEERNALFAERFRNHVTYPHMHTVKATHAKTGEFMGLAGWHAPEHMTGAFTGMFRPSTIDKVAEGSSRLTGEDYERAWAPMDAEGWDAEFGGYDDVRKRLMGDEPHWYLAPLFVLPQHRGRGVGTALMRYAMDLADAHDPPQRLYLEAFPNARPVYMHCGFESLPDPKDDFEYMVMIRPKQEKEKAKSE